MSEVLPRADEADVALLLEGTFPYVSGGVSSWVNQIIRAFPDIRFAVVFIGSRPSDYGAMRYPLPDNVVHLERHFIHDFQTNRVAAKDRPGDDAAFADIARLHDAFHAFSARAERTGLTLFPRIAEDMVVARRISLDDFLHSELSWEFVTESYRHYCQDPSFVDYFWTVRIMHAPLWQLAKVARGLIPVRAYHAISTGYAGFLGALLKHVHGHPLILSEHGIYTKERKIDLFQSEWIRDNRNVFQRDVSELPYFRQMWIRFFEWLGRVCYDAADPILSLYEANRQRQVIDGADPGRTRCIPNGIALPRFAPLRAQRPEKVPPVLCLIGRVVPIKDVKTFIRAMRRVLNHLPDAEGWIAGPEDEDRAYADECRNLAASQGLADRIRFLGFQRVEDILPKVGLVVLSSISEALPLVILEGYAAGVPTVSTDVGSCRQLVEGVEVEDRALGRSGRIVRIADPEALADAALELLQVPSEWDAASAAGIARVERYYRDELMFQRYGAVYRTALAAAKE